ncbi:3-demethoxyubiquinol 3-hydroxylase [Acrasis kona]|uniref:5-demethoxyubiquinone hydroxylase, mitochondrial n=1 Tax=Acrasis kona TaxID=1008807 RepID=A0AAW2Z3Z5_9EUKA
MLRNKIKHCVFHVPRRCYSGVTQPIDYNDPRINKSGRIWGWDDKKRRLESMIRVDQAGEFGAVIICRGQASVLVNDPVISEIQSQEENHLKVMEELVAERRVRPTILSPIWNVAGFAMGAATASLGRPSAMACHKAVEDVISEHYNDQIRDIHEMYNEPNDDFTSEKTKEQEQEYLFKTKAVDTREEELRKVLKQFRDEELHHGEMAVENEAQSAPFYQGMYTVIKSACNVAIWLSKKI